MPDRPNARRTVTCDRCPHQLITGEPGRVKHNADGSHTFQPATPPGNLTDPKPRGRRYA